MAVVRREILSTKRTWIANTITTNGNQRRFAVFCNACDPRHEFLKLTFFTKGFHCHRQRTDDVAKLLGTNFGSRSFLDHINGSALGTSTDGKLSPHHVSCRWCEALINPQCDFERQSNLTSPTLPISRSRQTNSSKPSDDVRVGGFVGESAIGSISMFDRPRHLRERCRFDCVEYPLLNISS